MLYKSGSSLGNQLKFWKNNKFIKIDTRGIRESISEVLVSELQSHIINSMPFVDYDFYYDKELGLGCISDNFLLPEESCISIYSLLKDFNIPLQDGGSYLRDSLLGLSRMEYGINLEDYLSYLVYLDSITLNIDRHLRNICLVVKNGRPYKCAPVFDNGLSLCSHIPITENISDSIHSLEFQPFDSDWENQIKLFKRDPLIIDVEPLIFKLKDVHSNPELYCSSQPEYLVRAIEVLCYQLSKLEGIVWKKK